MPSNIDLKIKTIPVTVKTRKLKAKYTLENAQDIKSVHGMEDDGKNNLLKKLKKVKIKEIFGKKLNKKDKELIDDWNKKDYDKHSSDVFGRLLSDMLSKEISDSIDKELIEGLKIDKNILTKPKTKLYYMKEMQMAGNNSVSRKLNDGIDFYPTPPWATKALLDREKFEGLIWEPACGDGMMSKVIEKYYPDKVESTELRTDGGYGQGDVDFLRSKKKYQNNIITNPPFCIAQKFIEHGKQLVNKKIAMLLRTAFLESKGRYNMFQDKEFPLATMYQFVERVQFAPNKIELTGGLFSFAWFVWEKSYKGNPVIKWIDDRPSLNIKEPKIKLF